MLRNRTTILLWGQLWKKILSNNIAVASSRSIFVFSKLSSFISNNNFQTKPISSPCESLFVFKKLSWEENILLKHTCNISSHSSSKYHNDRRKKGGARWKHLLMFSLPFFFGGKEKEEVEEDKEDKDRADLILNMKRSILLMQRNDYDSAEQLLHVVLKSAQDMGDDQAITYIFDLLANLNLQRGDYKAAHDVFSEVLRRILSAGVPENDNSVVEITLKLGSIFAHLGEEYKADQSFLYCITKQDEKLKAMEPENVDEDTLVLWAMAHDWYARYLLSRKRYSRAQEHFQKALDVCIKVKGPEDEQTAILYNDLGSACSLQENYEGALKYLKKAVRLAVMRDYEELASFYLNLANIYLMKGDTENALKSCRKALYQAREMKDEEMIKESNVCLEEIKNVQIHGTKNKESSALSPGGS